MAQRLTVEFFVNEGMDAEFEAVALPAAARVREEDPGCLQYHFFKSLDDPTKYVLVEAWDTVENLAAHGQSPAIAGMRELGPFLSGRSVLHRYED